MLGRYEIISEMIANPILASTNDTVWRASPVGRSKPSVSNDDPLMMKASDTGSTPMPQNTAVKPRIMNATHVPGRASSATGAYIA